MENAVKLFSYVVQQRPMEAAAGDVSGPLSSVDCTRPTTSITQDDQNDVAPSVPNQTSVRSRSSLDSSQRSRSTFLVARALASPNGAPQQACSSMTPGHGYNPQTGKSPFIVLPLASDIMQSTFVPIGLSSISDDYFRGFLLMAFDKDDNPIGKFSIERNGRLMSCSNGTNNAVTHSTNDDKMFVLLNWMPPSYFTGPVQFRATFVKNVSHYWVNTDPSVLNVTPFPMPSSGANFASTSSLFVLPLLALFVGKF